MNEHLLARISARARNGRKATDMATPEWPAREYSPLSADEIVEVERRLGFLLPSSLTTVYTHVGNGGFGPAYGLLGLVGGAPNEDGDDAVSLYEAFRASNLGDPHWKWPERLLPIGHIGCAMYACVDCSYPEVPVIWFEPNPHCDGESWDDSFLKLAPSLEEWLTSWLDGGADDLFSRAIPLMPMRE